jgi:hypothetical protein
MLGRLNLAQNHRFTPKANSQNLFSPRNYLKLMALVNTSLSDKIKKKVRKET